MIPISEQITPPRWQVFTAAPHRVMFFGGALQVMAAMLWWLLDLTLRYGMGGPAEWVIAPNAAHAYLMLYGMFPFFMFGFLMTTFPRWMAGRVIPARRYVPAFVLLLFGAALYYPGLVGGKMLLAISVALTLCGWAIACYAMLSVLLDTARQDKRHPIVALLALGLGWCGVASYLIWLLSDDAMWLNLALQVGIWLFLLPVFITVGHRMIPFFTSGHCQVHRPDWPWWVILACSAGHGLLQLSGASAWLWLCDVPLAVSALYTSYAWNLRRSLAVPMLAVLHAGIAWLGVAALLFTAQSLARLNSHDGHVLFGLAPLHALTVGCASTLLLGMATRVTLGHAGLSIYGNKSIWFLFAGFQAVVLLRVLADILPVQWGYWLYLAAAAGWLACFLPWVVTYLPVYVRPRADGQPG